MKRIAALAVWVPMLMAQAGDQPLRTVSAVRYWTVGEITRIAVEVSGDFEYRSDRLHNPERVYYDVLRAMPRIEGKKLYTRTLEDKLVKRVRVAETQPGITRIVLDLDGNAEASASKLNNPSRLIIELRAGGPARSPETPAITSAAPGGGENKAPVSAMRGEVPSGAQERKAADTPVRETRTPGPAPVETAAKGPVPTVSAPVPQAAPKAEPPVRAAVVARAPGAGESNEKPAETGAAVSRPVVKPEAPERIAAEPPKAQEAPVRDAGVKPPAKAEAPERIASGPPKAQEAPVRDAGAKPPAKAEAPERIASGPPKAQEALVRDAGAKPPAKAEAPERIVAKAEIDMPSAAAKPTSTGENSLVRTLGLKLGRVVIDPGHGGHDQGTEGPHGLLEKDVVLDIALRLGKLVESRLGAEVIYTRSDDTFVPLEGRTALANERKADLFLSVHANSSSLPRLAGVETYYLNIKGSSKDALDVAARENASSQKSIFELADVIQNIAKYEKAEESLEFAKRIQASLFAFSARNVPGARNRGVRTAPFVVLIGAHMPSVLAEIGFLSNVREETLLRKPDYRQKLAEALYRGVSRYADSLSHFQVATAKE